MVKWHGTVVDGTIRSHMARAEPLLLAGRVDACVQRLLLFGCSPALLALATTSDPPLAVSLPATWALSTLLPMPILRTAAGQLKTLPWQLCPRGKSATKSKQIMYLRTETTLLENNCPRRHRRQIQGRQLPTIEYKKPKYMNHSFW
mgnify:FL=1